MWPCARPCDTPCDVLLGNALGEHDAAVERASAVGRLLERLEAHHAEAEVDAAEVVGEHHRHPVVPGRVDDDRVDLRVSGARQVRAHAPETRRS